MESSTLIVVAAVAIAVMGAVWFGIKFWLASTRPADIKDVHTPALDRLNRAALEGVRDDIDEKEEEDEDDVDEEELEEEESEEPDDDAPRGLKDAVPGDGPRR